MRWGAGSDATIGVVGHATRKDATMSSDTGSDDELIPNGTDEGPAAEGDRRSFPREDTATRLTRGVVDGFTEASQAFSRELEGTNRFPELMGRSLAGMIRANARLLDEVATIVRQAADGGGQAPATGDLDYERLADLVAARLGSSASGSAPADPASATPGRRTS